MSNPRALASGPRASRERGGQYEALGERYVHHEADVVGRVLRIFLQVVEGKLKARGPQAPTTARFGAVTLVHRCGAALHAGSGPGMATL